MKRVWTYISEKQCRVVCIIILILMFTIEAAAMFFFEKDTVSFNVLMGAVIACPFLFVFFLQGAWRV